MQKRLFVGISVPDDIKKRIFRVADKEFKNADIALAAKENYHLTLDFLGYVREEKIPEICDSIRAAAGEQESFEIDFLRIETGPSEKSKRLVWITGEENEQLNELASGLDRDFGAAFARRKKFIPHITLARIKRGGRGLAPADLDKKIDFVFSVPVYSIELFESKYERGKRVYYVLESFPLR